MCVVLLYHYYITRATFCSVRGDSKGGFYIAVVYSMCCNSILLHTYSLCISIVVVVVEVLLFDE